MTTARRLKCPHCGQEGAEATEAAFANEIVYRRRKCTSKECSKYFSTGEIVLPEGVRPIYRNSMKTADANAHLRIIEAITGLGQPRRPKPPRREPTRVPERILTFLRQRGRAKRAEIDRAMQPTAPRTVEQHLYALKRLGRVSREDGYYMPEGE